MIDLVAGHKPSKKPSDKPSKKPSKTSSNLSKQTIKELKLQAKQLGLTDYSRLRKNELIELINNNNSSRSASINWREDINKLARNIQRNEAVSSVPTPDTIKYINKFINTLIEHIISESNRSDIRSAVAKYLPGQLHKHSDTDFKKMM